MLLIEHSIILFHLYRFINSYTSYSFKSGIQPTEKCIYNIYNGIMAAIAQRRIALDANK